MRAPSIVFTEHARWEMVRRGLSEVVVRKVIRHAEQIIPIRAGREIRQSRVYFKGDGKDYLVRAIVDIMGNRLTVVTVYRTSKIEKYWRQP